MLLSRGFKQCDFSGIVGRVSFDEPIVTFCVILHSPRHSDAALRRPPAGSNAGGIAAIDEVVHDH